MVNFNSWSGGVRFLIPFLVDIEAGEDFVWHIAEIRYHWARHRFLSRSGSGSSCEPGVDCTHGTVKETSLFQKNGMKQEKFASLCKYYNLSLQIL